MAVPDRPLSEEDLDLCDWQAVVEQSPRGECYAYADTYFRSARDVFAESESCANVFDLLAKVTALSFRHEDQFALFAPEELLNAIRAEDLRRLVSRADEVEDAELRARIRDLAWVQLRDHTQGVAAIADYLELSDAFAAAENWFAFYHRLRRALDLSLRLNQRESTMRLLLASKPFSMATTSGIERSTSAKT